MYGIAPDVLGAKDSAEFPRYLLESTEDFATEEECHQYPMRIRWPDGFVCPRSEGALTWPTRRGQLFCAACKTQTSATAGSVLHGWFQAMRLARTQKSGLSAADLQRANGRS